MQSKKIKILIPTGLFLLVGFLWLGVGEDPEFFNYSPFVKTRPCPKFVFHSPVGMQNTKSAKLTKKQKYEEYMYRQLFGANGTQWERYSFKFCKLIPSSEEVDEMLYGKN